MPGIISCLIVGSATCIAVIGILGYGAANLRHNLRIDPIHLVMISGHPSKARLEINDSTIFRLCLILLYLFIVLEMSRIVSLAMALQIFLMDSRRKMFKTIEEISKLHLGKAIRLYRRMSVLNLIIKNGLGPITACTMGIGFVLILSCALFLLQRVEETLLIVYWVHGLVLSNAMLMIQFVLPQVTGEYQLTSGMLKRWKTGCRKMGGAISVMRKKEIEALQPLGLNFGSFKRLDGAARLEYLDSLSSRTIDSCLLFQEQFPG